MRRWLKASEGEARGAHASSRAVRASQAPQDIPDSSRRAAVQSQHLHSSRLPRPTSSRLADNTALYASQQLSPSETVLPVFCWTQNAMNTPRTPRMRSAYPLSPSTNIKRSASPAKRTGPAVRTPTAEAKPSASSDSGPLIPLSTLDAPSQRFYVFAVYAALLAWRLYDFSGVLAHQGNSLWLFMKWSAIDGLVFFGLPSLRIPWLEWSTFTVMTLFGVHSLANAILMFRVPIPIEGWIVAMLKIFWDKEIAISERHVQAASLIQNSSLILGKQIIHILPEGSASLNPESQPFCLGRGRNTVYLPLHINQTVPTSIELLRSDLESNEVESVVFSAKEVNRFKKEAEKHSPKDNKGSLRLWRLPVKQPGFYRLGKVVDESNLEVQAVRAEALVVPCPSAAVKPSTQNRCKGELSNFFIEVDATPPLKIWYTRTINRGADTSVSLTWHPDDLASPLQGNPRSGPLTRVGSAYTDVSWARNRRHQIAVNETMSTSGGWQYFIDKVQDGCGNTVEYGRKEEDRSSRAGRPSHLEQDFIVHERPRARLSDCTLQNPKRVASGGSSSLGVSLNPLGQHDTKAAKHHITYSFAPSTDDGPEQNTSLVRQEAYTMSYNGQGPVISEPGVYSLLSVATDQCAGEVLEPSSCLLLNPPRPDVSITSEDIPDKCAGNSVGILAHLDLVGSPPFVIRYTEQRRGGSLSQKTERIDTLRHQLAFEPTEAGHYTYQFLEVSDSVYQRAHSLKHKGYKLEQDIKPTAWARFREHQPRKAACLDQTASFDVQLTGEGPWALEYDLVHGRSRQKIQLKDIESDVVQLKTPALTRGGTYSITLSSVTDTSGCKIYLDQEAKVEVRQQKPSVGFGNVDGTRSIRSLQNQKVRLPLRLSGERPWTVMYSKAGSNDVHRVRVDSSNGFIETQEEGTYVLQSVKDAGCPGVVDESSSAFAVQWITRPGVSLAPSKKIFEKGAMYIKQAVCEGEQDSFEIALSGNGPYKIKYDIQETSEHGSQATQNRQETYASTGALIRMQTARAGTFKYTLSDVSDRFYDLGHHKSQPIVVQQQVNARPNAAFTNAGKTYSYCKEDDSGNEVIPVTMTGKPPFTLEIGIKHKSSLKPDIHTISDIPSNRYNIEIPRGSLGVGGYSVGIVRVMDGNGCQRVRDRSEGDVVHVVVVDVPTITPMEGKSDYCVGDRIAYSLSGTAPFNVFYTFEGVARKAAVSNTDFRRLAEKPGVFAINAVSDRASTDACRARTNITKVVHELPSARISKGKTYEVDIHEGGETDIVFEFGGSPPFEFTYTRSTNAGRGKKSVVLETRHEVSSEHVKVVRAFEEGTYEVVAIRDKYCSVTMQGKLARVSPGQKLLT